MRLSLAVAAALLAATASAQSFQHERTITPGGKGPNRLDADIALLSGTQPQFPDLRLFDSSGAEVPYLFVALPAREPSWVRAQLLAVAATKTTSGFEADLGALRTVDRLRMRGIRPPYLKHVTLEGSGDRTRWTLVADTTVFDLPDQNLERAEIAFAPGTYRYLRVAWDDRNSARVSALDSAEARLHEPTSPPEPLRAPLPLRKLSSEPGKSRYHVDLPGARLPIAALELRVSGGDVFRNATVSEPQLTNGAIIPSPLGSGLLRRAVRNGFIAAEMSIPIRRPAGRELDLVIDDGTNPPLPLTEVVARFEPQPWIYFESAGGSPISARYGSPKLGAPRYDLEAARQFVARTPIAIAKWSGAPKVLPPSNVTESTPPMAAFGASVDPASFRISRPLQNARGLVVLPLDLDVLANSRSLADVRIVDAKGKQVPYIVEHRDDQLATALKPAKVESKPGESRYRIALPYTTLPSGCRLVFTTSARVFDRTVRLMRPTDEERGREESELDRAQWKNTTPEVAAAPLTFDSTLTGAASVDLVVSEGDNEPLPISSATLLVPSYALRFNHPGAALRLVYGNDSISTPQYDLALLAPRILVEPATTIAITSAAKRVAESRADAKFFWIIIAVAAVVLFAMLGRLLLRA